MILMTSQSCATSEGLLTVGVGTLVGSFTRMYSSMSRKRAGVTKRLRGVSTFLRNAMANLPCHIVHTCEVSLQCGHVDGQSMLIFE